MSTASKDPFHWHRRAQDCIAQGYLTNSKRPQSHVFHVYPTHVTRGHGCHLFGTDGQRYVDYICGLGTNLFGYGNERIAKAIETQLRAGYCHSFATPHEIAAAEKLKELVPFVEAVKFLKTGTEACAAAVRIARAATGRKLILSEGYHGWSDDFVSLTEPAVGVPRAAPYTRAIARLVDADLAIADAAAVIVEPVMVDATGDRRAWLQELRERCSKHGTLLIFDEVITGLRWPRGSVAAHWSITPDLIVLGKALGGGMPLAAVGGSYAVMNAEYFISSTYAGETLSLVAAKAAMELLQTRCDVNLLWERGQAFMDGFNAIAPELVRLDGYPTRGVFVGEPLTKALFFQELCTAGVLFGPSWFFNFLHHDETQSVLQLCRDALTRIKAGAVELRGELPQSPFAEKVRAGNR